MRLSMLLIIPVVVTLLIVSLVPLPSYDGARQINVSICARIIATTGSPEMRLASNYTTPGYWYHTNAFWAGSLRENEPPVNYSWHLEIIRGEHAGGVPQWTAHHYWAYSLKGGYWFNETFSFEGQVGDSYTFILRLHYELPIGNGEVQGILATTHLDVTA